MLIPRPLVISLLIGATLLMALSVITDLETNALWEIFALTLIIAIVINLVYGRDGKENVANSNIKSVTDLPKIEQMVTELENLRKHHRQILIDLPLGVCALDKDEKITIWNPTLEKLTRLASKDISAKHLTSLQEPWLSLLHNFTTSPYTHLYKQSFEFEGRKRTVNLHKSRIGNTTGQGTEDTGTLVLLEDITETETLEAGLTHSERLASIGRLAAGVAHEIGNPITGIACLAQNICDEYGDGELQLMAQQIVEQTERTSRIVQSLVNFAHAGTSASHSDQETIVIRDIVDEAITLVSLDKKGKSMHYQVDCDGDVRISGDPQRFLQVLINLINNSRDASQPDSTIDIGCKATPQKTVITIEDQGVGISEAVRDRIFDPFFTTKEAGDGTGLGLSLVYSIVEDLQGEIDIISPANRDSNRGTRVILSFPSTALNGVESTESGSATDV